MPRKIIRTLMASAVALAGLTAAPAAADHNRHLEKFIIGAGTLLLLNELSNGNTALIYRTDRYRDHRDRRYRDDGYYRYKPAKPRKPQGAKHRRAALPAYCLTRVRTGNGPVRMFDKRCLKRNYRQADRLPQACRVTVRSWGQGQQLRRLGYDPLCLRNRGFRVAGNR